MPRRSRSRSTGSPSRSPSPNPRSNRGRDHGGQPPHSRNNGQQPAPYVRDPRRTQPRSDPLFKALNQKNRKGRQGQEMTGPLQVYHRAGKLIPRLVDPWLDIEQVFMTALTSGGQLRIDGWGRSAEDETAEEASDRQTLEKRQKDAYKKIVKLAPNMISTLDKLCNSSQDHDEELHDSILLRFIEVLHDAANHARVADTAKVNKAICELMIKEIGGHLTPPVPYDKCMRGWEHIDTGRFNCPARLINDYDASLLAKLKAGEIVVTAHDFPFFMYDPDLMDEGDIWAGLCRGYLLFRTVEEMFFGSGKPRITNHATKDPIAVKFGFTSITPEIIAYGACQARFSLSSVSEWPMQDMAFDLHDFYYNILFLFEEQDDVWASETLAHWNKHFFPANGRSRGSRKRQAIPPPSSNNDITKLRNERARRLGRHLARPEPEMATT